MNMQHIIYTGFQHVLWCFALVLPCAIKKGGHRKHFPPWQAIKYTQSSGLWEILDINSFSGGEKQEKHVYIFSLFFPEKYIVFAYKVKWKLFQP